MTHMDFAHRLVGIQEKAGTADHPFIVWALSLCGLKDSHDETPWCSAFVNAVCFLAGLPRSLSAAARSWLTVGIPVHLEDALPGDVVILKRGTGLQPGPEVLDAPGHVGFLTAIVDPEGKVYLLGGNQGDGVKIAGFDTSRIIGVRRLT